MPKIKQSVGKKGVNKPDDVKVVQTLLARHASWLIPAPVPVATGIIDPATILAIKLVQERAAALLLADGLVSPGGYTMTALNMAAIAEPTHNIFKSVNWAHPSAGAITVADYEAAAISLDCKVAAIRAVAATETQRDPWDDLGRPTILYERHKFSKHSDGRYDRSHPDISNKNGGGYGRFAAQYPKLRRAAILHEEAALKSASWGTFQILGENHVAAGYATVAAFVDGMMHSERKHLDAFVSFIKANAGMLKAIRALDWATFARLYNGPGYKKNDYDTKVADAYKSFSPVVRPAPGAGAGAPSVPRRTGTGGRGQ